MKKAVIFDFDGVMADTEMKTLVYMEQAFAKYGIILSHEEKMAYIGSDGREHTNQILMKNRIDITAEDFLKEKRKLGNVYENSTDLQLMPGLREFLMWLKKEEYKIGLVSSTSSRLIVIALNRLGIIGFLDTLICGDMVKNKKPDPEGYLLAMKYLGIKPEEAVIIEDSPIGICAGKAAGAYVIGYKGAEAVQDTSAADVEWKSYVSFEEKWRKIARL